MADINDLSEREREILVLAAKGASNKQIAQELFISTNTVKVHLRHIFNKIGVASRTEAAMFAVGAGLVDPGGAANQAEITGIPPGLPGDSEGKYLKEKKLRSRRLLLAGAAAGSIIIVLLGLFLFWEWYTGSTGSGSESEAGDFSRWQVKADMLTPRYGMGLTTYANQIFTIAGEKDDGVTNLVERYDPTIDQWDGLTPKPVPVADVSAVAIGGEIFVPGGRLGTGELSNFFEAYDPEDDLWFEREPLPVPLCAYTLAAFEGSVYMFGGWDGEKFVDSVYVYNPISDGWREQSPMKTARGFAGGAVAGGKIYIIGGINEDGVLDVNEVYQPGQEGEAGGPWSTASPLPEPRYAMGVASVADIIHIIGGIGNAEVDLYSLVYFPNSDKWEKFTNPFSGTWSNLGLVPLESRLYAMGGVLDDSITKQNLAYQAIYTVLFPVVK
jgi:DNA-binding CsgD family transcriptional regulator